MGEHDDSSGSVADEVSALKDQPGKGIVATGSITLVHELIAHGLVDECRLFTYVVLLGHGRRLFQDATNVRGLVLRDVRRFGSTVVLTTTTPASSAHRNEPNARSVQAAAERRGLSLGYTSVP